MKVYPVFRMETRKTIFGVPYKDDPVLDSVWPSSKSARNYCDKNSTSKTWYFTEKGLRIRNEPAASTEKDD